MSRERERGRQLGTQKFSLQTERETDRQIDEQRERQTDSWECRRRRKTLDRCNVLQSGHTLWCTLMLFVLFCLFVCLFAFLRSPAISLGFTTLGETFAYVTIF